MTRPPHDELILDQFTRQAVPFSTAKTIADESALQLLVDFSGCSPDDNVLDVACGGGLVVCAFARGARHATGLDLTPAMLERARLQAQKAGLRNVTWDLGHAAPLPYPDGAFTIVVSRFAFHHFSDPRAVLAEMARVCAPGGRILVCDVQASDDPHKAAAFNRMEVLRDPSHVRAIPTAELRGLFRAVGLPEPRATHYELRDELENLLRRSFPNPGDDEKIRAIFRASVEDDRLGIPLHLHGAEIRYAYPVVLLCSDRPSRDT
jgi:ubiquinone/menaquinone biosynthesis C-methylase UbiE